MPLVIREIHASSSPAQLNEEWFVVENTGEKAFSTMGCSVSVGRGSSRVKPIGTMEPGFTLAAGEKIRVVSGNPAKKAQGRPPEGMKVYHLFLAAPLLQGAGKGTVLALSLKQHELARAVFDPKAQAGVG